MNPKPLKRWMPPTHPGLILKELYLTPLKISTVDLCINIKVARKTVSELINGHTGVSADMALKLAKTFDTTPELWLNMQRNYDLWYAIRKVELNNVQSLRKVKSDFTESNRKSITKAEQGKSKAVKTKKLLK